MLTPFLLVSLNVKAETKAISAPPMDPLSFLFRTYLWPAQEAGSEARPLPSPAVQRGKRGNEDQDNKRDRSHTYK